MKKLAQYLKKRPLALTSLIFLALVYLIMIFAEFFAPYQPTQTFENNTYHVLIFKKSIQPCSGAYTAALPTSADTAQQ